MAGCPPDVVAAARQEAIDRSKGGPDDHVLSLGRSFVEPFLSRSSRRDLRTIVSEAFSNRGGGLFPGRDNADIAVEILRLRRRLAGLHGRDSYAEFRIEDTMAGTPEAGMSMLDDIWNKAKDAAGVERRMMESFLSEEEEEGGSGDIALGGGIQSWDWRYYAERVRCKHFTFDESEMRPYLSLHAVTNAAFDVSNKLYGLRYIKREDIVAYHPDVDVYEVRRAKEDGSGEDDLVAIFLHDNYSRPQKRSGAWSSYYRKQKKNLAAGSDPFEGIPIVVNSNNFSKGSKHTLLSFSDGTTLFHELGHGHHAMLSDCYYEYLSGTSVLKDFVEFPSQVSWCDHPLNDILYVYFFIPH